MATMARSLSPHSHKTTQAAAALLLGSDGHEERRHRGVQRAEARLQLVARGAYHVVVRLVEVLLLKEAAARRQHIGSQIHLHCCFVLTRRSLFGPDGIALRGALELEALD